MHNKLEIRAKMLRKKVMKKRNVTSFEPDADVAEMLIQISGRGITIREVANLALRRYGLKIAKEVAEKKRRQLSFEKPNDVPFGLQFELA